MRTELDDIWVIQWSADQGGDEADDKDQKFNKENDETENRIKSKCSELNKEYKYIRVDMDPDKQTSEDNPDSETDFKQLMLKMKVDDEDYTKISEGPVVTIIYRLNGVKVTGEDLDTYVCDFISMKKDERAAHEREVA